MTGCIRLLGKPGCPDSNAANSAITVSFTAHSTYLLRAGPRALQHRAAAARRLQQRSCVSRRLLRRLQLQCSGQAGG